MQSTSPAELATVDPASTTSRDTANLAAAPAANAPATTVYVCTTCRLSTEPPEPRDQRAGARLHAALQVALSANFAEHDIRVEAVECLSVCRRACTVAFTGAGKWTYVVGNYAAEGADEILAAAAQFAATADGLIPWRERSEALKRNVVSRLPPQVPSGPLSQEQSR